MCYTHMTEDERYELDELLRDGFSQRAIGAQLKRSPSTISRELRRNKGERGWRPRQAQRKSVARLTARGSHNVKRVSLQTWEYAKNRLINDQWSPEQISGRLNHEGLLSISHETIYQRILKDKQAGSDLYRHLRSKKKKKKRYGSGEYKREIIPGRVDISKRPAIVETRKRIGDWEGDTIIGSHTGGAVLASMVDRKSRFTMLVKAANKSTKAVIDGISQCMLPLSHWVSTVTFDNGREFCMHQSLADTLDAKIYFATPYYSWERGLNENTNGLVRQYFPKKTPFDNISQDDLRRVVEKINNRPRKCPRKCLGYKTPFEVLSAACKRKGVALCI